MDAFSYLSVLISIILGLAVTQVLQAFRGLMLARHRVQGYWPAWTWAILILVICVQVWWALFTLHDRPADRWTFLDFSAVLAQVVPLYLAAGLTLPEAPGGGGVDLRAHYYAHHRWFFGMLALLIVCSVGKARLLMGAWPAPPDLGFQALFLVAAVIGAWTPRERYHQWLAPASAVALGAYIAVLFMHLQ